MSILVKWLVFVNVTHYPTEEVDGHVNITFNYQGYNTRLRIAKQIKELSVEIKQVT